ncbi:hypothetical protein DIPPA_31900 [Diplonema papillatum]|nr:hypothetical protein DIPPA_31900 [Diplonema papillatum]
MEVFAVCPASNTRYALRVSKKATVCDLFAAVAAQLRQPQACFGLSCKGDALDSSDTATSLWDLDVYAGEDFLLSFEQLPEPEAGCRSELVAAHDAVMCRPEVSTA